MSIISTILSIFTWVVLGVAALMILINLLLARRRSWILAVIRLGMTVLAAIISVPASKIVAIKLTDFAYNQLIPSLSQEVQDVITAASVGEEGLKVLASLLIAPLIFLFVFILLRLVFTIIGCIVVACVPVLKERSLSSVSMPVGAVNGLLITMIVFVPLCGFLAFGGHILNTASTTVQTTNSPAIDEMLTEMDIDHVELAELGESLEKNPAVMVIHSTVGRPIFDSLTTGQTDSTKTHGTSIQLNLEKEVGGLLNTAILLIDAADSLKHEDYTEADKNKLFAVEESLFDSEWRTMLMSDALNAAADSWLDNKPFAGKDRPSVDATIDPTLIVIFEIFSEEDYKTLEEDLRVLIDVVGDLLMCDLLASDIDPQEMIRTLSEKQILDKALSKLKANARLAPLATELKTMSVRLVTDMLGLEELKSGEHAELMNNVADELTKVSHMSPEERHEIISESLNDVFAQSGIDVPKDVAIELSDKMIDDLTAEGGEITGERLTDYLVDHAADVGELLPDEIPDDLPMDEIPGLESLPVDLPGEEETSGLPLDSLPADLPIDSLPDDLPVTMPAA